MVLSAFFKRRKTPPVVCPDGGDGATDGCDRPSGALPGGESDGGGSSCATTAAGVALSDGVGVGRECGDGLFPSTNATALAGAADGAAGVVSPRRRGWDWVAGRGAGADKAVGGSIATPRQTSRWVESSLGGSLSQPNLRGHPRRAPAGVSAAGEAAAAPVGAGRAGGAREGGMMSPGAPPRRGVSDYGLWAVGVPSPSAADASATHAALVARATDGDGDGGVFHQHPVIGAGLCSGGSSWSIESMRSASSDDGVGSWGMARQVRGGAAGRSWQGVPSPGGSCGSGDSVSEFGKMSGEGSCGSVRGGTTDAAAGGEPSSQVILFERAPSVASNDSRFSASSSPVSSALVGTGVRGGGGRSDRSAARPVRVAGGGGGADEAVHEDCALDEALAQPYSAGSTARPPGQSAGAVVTVTDGAAGTSALTSPPAYGRRRRPTVAVPVLSRERWDANGTDGEGGCTDDHASGDGGGRCGSVCATPPASARAIPVLHFDDIDEDGSSSRTGAPVSLASAAVLSACAADRAAADRATADGGGGGGALGFPVSGGTTPVAGESAAVPMVAGIDADGAAMPASPRFIPIATTAAPIAAATPTSAATAAAAASTVATVAAAAAAVDAAPAAAGAGAGGGVRLPAPAAAAAAAAAAAGAAAAAAGAAAAAASTTASTATTSVFGVLPLFGLRFRGVDPDAAPAAAAPSPGAVAVAELVPVAADGGVPGGGTHQAVLPGRRSASASAVAAALRGRSGSPDTPQRGRRRSVAPGNGGRRVMDAAAAAGGPGAAVGAAVDDELFSRMMSDVRKERQVTDEDLSF
ncbi:hypothetical protein MMPV_005960 [Pyropia vietnamensis]